MATPKEWPHALLRRWLLTAAAGLGFLLAGLAVFLVSRDCILLMLSILLALLTLLRCLSFYRIASAGNFEVVEGVCIGVKRLPLRRQQGIRLLTAEGIEHTVTLDKHMRLCIGNLYRAYFKSKPVAGQDALPFHSVLEQDLFLGLEDLGEYHAEAK